MTLYRRFLRLFQDWPLDKTKVGRDLGAQIRKSVADAFPQGENSQVDAKYWEASLKSMSRLTANYHKNNYPRLKENNCTGLTAEECQLVLSTETLEMLQAEDQTFVERMRSKMVEKEANKGISSAVANNTDLPTESTKSR